METQNAPPSGKRRPWRMALPLILVLILAGGWIAYWFGATKFAAFAMDRLIASEAARGRIITCEQRDQGGFPFRFEVTCLNPTIVWQTPQGPASAKLERLSGVALAYNLGHVIIDLTGPMEVTLPPMGTRPQRVRASWQSARTSIIADILSDPGPRNVATVVEQLQVWAGANDTVFSGPATLVANNVESHALRKDRENSNGPDFDIYLTADNLVLREPNGGTTNLANFIRVEMFGTAFAVPILETRNLQHFVSLWQQRGGRLDIQRLWMDEGRTAMLAKGDLTLSPIGSVDGNATVAVSGADAIISRIDGQSSEQSRVAKIALGALGMIGKPVTMGDRQGTEVPLVFKDGVLSLGGFLNIQLPRLFVPNIS